jgi:hypothetical protein
MKLFLSNIWNILIIYQIIWHLYSFINLQYIYKIAHKSKLSEFNLYERTSLKLFTIFTLIGIFINFYIFILILMLSFIIEFVISSNLIIKTKGYLIRLEIILILILIYLLL